MTLETAYVIVSALIPLGLLALVAVSGVGVLSAVVHDRDEPETLVDRAFWVSRGVAYATALGAVAGGVLWSFTAAPVVTVAVLAVLALASVPVIRRRRLDGGDESGADAE